MKRRFQPELGRGGRPLRIAYGRIFHEANAHSPISVTERDFRGMHYMVGEELRKATTLRGSELVGYMPHAELTGFVQAANVAGGVESVPLSSALTVPGGPISKECFEWLLNDLLDRLKAAGPLDGVYLALHGSSEVQGLAEAPEAVILRKVRELLGPDAGLAVSYDLHANFASELLDPVDVMIAYRTNPHWDLAPTGFRAGNRLIRTLRGQIKPVHAWRKLPMVLGGGITIDFMAPMRKVFRWMRKLERDPRVLSASLFMVHPYTSADNLGWAVHVCTDDDPQLAARLADQLADRAWDQRKAEIPPLRGAAEVLDEVKSGVRRRLGPVTLVDVDDIVGAGAPGGNTHIVRELTRDDRGLKVMLPLHDPELVDELWDAPLDSERTVTLRGTPGYNMPSVTLPVVVKAKLESDFGRLIRLDSGSFHVAIGERPPLPISPRFWRELGLNPRKADALVQKNFFHYRMFYATTSWAHLPVQTDGATSLHRVRNREYQVPTYPGHDPVDWRDDDAKLRSLKGVRTLQAVRADGALPASAT